MLRRIGKYKENLTRNLAKLAVVLDRATAKNYEEDAVVLQPLIRNTWIHEYGCEVRTKVSIARMRRAGETGHTSGNTASLSSTDEVDEFFKFTK
jgi:hypothetical protein